MSFIDSVQSTLQNIARGFDQGVNSAQQYGQFYQYERYKLTGQPVHSTYYPNYATQPQYYGTQPTGTELILLALGLYLLIKA